MRRFREYVFIGLVAGGFVWNILCLFQVIPLENWRISLVMEGMGALIVLVPRVFHGPAVETAEPSAKPTAKERTWIGLQVGLCAAWFVTAMACMVFPL